MKHQWRSESNTVLQCTPAQTLYTSLSTLAKFKLPISRMRKAYIQCTECSCTCAMVHTRLQFLAIQAFFISASVMYMDVCMQHGGICTREHIAGMGIYACNKIVSCGSPCYILHTQHMYNCTIICRWRNIQGMI